MSQFLISTTEVVEILILIFEFVFIGLGLLYLYRDIRQDSYDNKVDKCNEKKRKIRDDFYEDIKHVDASLFSESEEYSKTVTEKKFKMDDDIRECDKEIESIKEKASKSKEISNIIMSSIVGVLIALFLLLCSVRSLVGGNIEYIVPIENNVNQDIAITAYYEVEYEGVNQETLTVFIRNDSQKTLENAILKEKTSGNTTEVKTLEPGEEKIVSINVYSSKDSNYEFELSNIEFKE